MPCLYPLVSLSLITLSRHVFQQFTHHSPPSPASPCRPAATWTSRRFWSATKSNHGHLFGRDLAYTPNGMVAVLHVVSRNKQRRIEATATDPSSRGCLYLRFPQYACFMLSPLACPSKTADTDEKSLLIASKPPVPPLLRGRLSQNVLSLSTTRKLEVLPRHFCTVAMYTLSVPRLGPCFPHLPFLSIT